jgi:hypothetical protein
MLDEVAKGQPIYQDNTPFTLMRNGYAEEAMFSFTLLPLSEPNQHCFAIYNPVFETTAATVAGKNTAVSASSHRCLGLTTSKTDAWAYLPVWAWLQLHPVT